MTKSNDKEPSQVRASTTLIKTDGIKLDELDAVTDEMTAALFDRIDAWRVRNGLPPLSD